MYIRINLYLTHLEVTSKRKYIKIILPEDTPEGFYLILDDILFNISLRRKLF